MQKLADLIKRKIAKNKKTSLRKDLAKFIKENPDVVLFYQRQQLFKKSVDASGEYGKALGFYSQATEVISEGKKKYNDPFTMVDSGAFKRGLFIDVKYNKITISSRTPDLDNILNNKVFDGLQLFGLNEDSERRMINRHIRPFITKWINERYTI